MIPPTDDGHCSRGLGSEKLDGRVMVFPSTSPNELRVTVYDPLGGVPVVELEVIKSYATGKHFQITLYPLDEILNDTISLSLKYGITIYDSAYISLGKVLGEEVYTADEKLLRKVSDLPFVHHIKDFRI
jgi:hypothetical protein